MKQNTKQNPIQQPQKTTNEDWIMTIVIIILIGCGGLLFNGCSTESQKSNDQQTEQKTETKKEEQTHKEYKEIKKIQGKGNSDSETFDLTGGKIKMTAKTWGSTVGSFSNVEFKGENNKYLSGASLSISTDGTEDGNGETIIRNVDAGKYYISVISGIDWEVIVYEEK